MRKNILVATAGIATAERTADYVVGIAESLEASLVALHILRDGETELDANASLDVFVSSAEISDVPIRKEIRSGDVATCIIECGEDSDAAMIVMGASEGRVVSEWISADVFEKTTIPVVVLPHQLKA